MTTGNLNSNRECDLRGHRDTRENRGSEQQTNNWNNVSLVRLEAGALVTCLRDFGPLIT